MEVNLQGKFVVVALIYKVDPVGCGVVLAVVEAKQLVPKVGFKEHRHMYLFPSPIVPNIRS